MFDKWAAYTLVGTRFHPAEVVDFLSTIELSDKELAAYGAPFPSRIYMSGVRAFPSLINTLSDRPTNEGAREVHERCSRGAREVLDHFDRPVLTLFGRRDENMGNDLIQSLMRDRVPGAVGQPHHSYEDAGHFVQEDKGEDVARRVNSFITANP